MMLLFIAGVIATIAASIIAVAALMIELNEIENEKER
jgi:hypothetical protein